MLKTKHFIVWGVYTDTEIEALDRLEVHGKVVGRATLWRDGNEGRVASTAEIVPPPTTCDGSGLISSTLVERKSELQAVFNVKWCPGCSACKPTTHGHNENETTT